MAQKDAYPAPQATYAMPGAEPEPVFQQSNAFGVNATAFKAFAISPFEIGDVGWCLYR